MNRNTWPIGSRPFFAVLVVVAVAVVAAAWHDAGRSGALLAAAIMLIPVAILLAGVRSLQQCAEHPPDEGNGLSIVRTPEALTVESRVRGSLGMAILMGLTVVAMIFMAVAALVGAFLTTPVLIIVPPVAALIAYINGRIMMWNLRGVERVRIEGGRLIHEHGPVMFSGRDSYLLSRISNVRAAPQPYRPWSHQDAWHHVYRISGGNVAFTAGQTPKRMGIGLTREEAEAMAAAINERLP